MLAEANIHRLCAPTFADVEPSLKADFRQRFLRSRSYVPNFSVQPLNPEFFKYRLGYRLRKIVAQISVHANFGNGSK